MLVWLLVLIFNEPLGELVHEVSGHAHYLGLVHAFLDFTVVRGRVVRNVALEVLVLILHLDIV